MAMWRIISTFVVKLGSCYDKGRVASTTEQE